MDPLEALVAQIQGLSSTSSDVNRLHSILKQVDDSLRSKSTCLPPLLTQLDPSIHSLGFLYILYVTKKINYKRYLSMPKTLVLEPLNVVVRLHELFYFDSFVIAEMPTWLVRSPKRRQRLPFQSLPGSSALAAIRFVWPLKNVWKYEIQILNFSWFIAFLETALNCGRS